MLSTLKSWMKTPQQPYTGPSINSVLPPELILHTLSFVDPKTCVFQCRFVCHQWRDTMIDSHLWKKKLARKGIHIPELPAEIPDHWVTYYWLCNENAFGQNLIRNPCGSEGYKYWEGKHEGGNGWAIERPPCGADPLPDVPELEAGSCFATSYGLCVKHQVIDLWSKGLSPFILNHLQPEILIEEWHAARFDCGSVYIMQAELLDLNMEVIVPYIIEITEEQWLGREWSKESHTFKEYGPGVRFVQFTHKGTDTQFWAGHYGSKMSGATVKVMLPQAKEKC